MKRLIDFFPNWRTTGGLFSTLTEMPWSDFIDGALIDKYYFGVHSGIKLATSTVSAFSVNGVADGDTLAHMIAAINIKNWERTWNAYVTVYSPLKNYSVTEHKERGLTGSDNNTKNLKETNTGTVGVHGADTTTRTDNLTQSTSTDTTDTITRGTQVTVAGTSTASRSGFNSATQVPVESASDNSTTTNSGTDTDRVVGSGSIRNTGTQDTEVETSSTRTDNLTKSNTGTDNHSITEDEEMDITREGNLGYQSYQQLIRQEFDLWKWSFFDRIFRDFDEVLALKVHDVCRTVN